MSGQIVFQGRKFQVVVRDETQPDGQALRREFVAHPGAVVILPFVDDDHVCLLRNYRFAIEETLWELPAGTLEVGEPPAEAAVRELAEETGYQARRWQKLREFYPSPGVLAEQMHLYVAHDLAPGPQQLEAEEQIEVHVVRWSTALSWALDGTIRDGKTLVALLLWEQLRSRP